MFVCLIEVLDYYNFFFFNDTATTEIYTLSLHDALPILASSLLLQMPDIRPAPSELIQPLLEKG